MEPVSRAFLTDGRFCDLIDYANKLTVQAPQHPLNAELFELYKTRIQQGLPADPDIIYFKHLPFQYLETLVNTAADRGAWPIAAGALAYNEASTEAPYPNHRNKIARMALLLVDRAETEAAAQDVCDLLNVARRGALLTKDEPLQKIVTQRTFQYWSNALTLGEVEAPINQLKELYLATTKTDPALHTSVEQIFFNFLNKARAAGHTEALERLHEYGAQMFPADSPQFKAQLNHALETVPGLIASEEFSSIGAILAYNYNHSPVNSPFRETLEQAWTQTTDTAIAAENFDAVGELLSCAYRKAITGCMTPEGSEDTNGFGSITLARSRALVAIEAAIAATKPNRAKDLYKIANNYEHHRNGDLDRLTAGWQRLQPKLRAAQNLGATTPDRLLPKLRTYARQMASQPIHETV